MIRSSIDVGGETGEAGTPPRPASGRALPAAVLPALLLVAVAAVVITGFWGVSYDDAFITYRYALHVQEEGRLAFGDGPPTYGTSAPGYAVLLGVLGRVGGAAGLDVPAWGSLLGMAGLLAVPLVLLAWGRGRGSSPASREGGRAAWLLPGALLVLTLRWNVEMLGGETLPALGLVAWGAYLLFRCRRETAAGLALAAAALLRLDAGLAAVVFGLVQWARNRAFPWRLAVAGTLPIALYLAGLHLHFGQLLPDTLDAKQAETALATTTLTHSQWLWLVRTLGSPGAVALLAFAALGVAALLAEGAWRRPAPVAVALWLAGHEAAYRLLGVPFAPWYHVATVTALALLAAYGAAAVAGRLPGSRLAASWLRRPEGAAPHPAVVIALTFLLLLPLWLPTLAWHLQQRGHPPDPRWDVYHAVGDHLRTASAPGDAVAAVEIGFLGYRSRRPILDLMGLVSPEVVEARRRGELPDLVARRAPRYLLDVPLFREATLGAILAHPEIRRCYATAATFPAPDAMGGEVDLLERRDDSTCGAEPGAVPAPTAPP